MVRLAQCDPFCQYYLLRLYLKQNQENPVAPGRLDYPEDHVGPWRLYLLRIRYCPVGPLRPLIQ